MHSLSRIYQQFTAEICRKLSVTRIRVLTVRQKLRVNRLELQEPPPANSPCAVTQFDGEFGPFSIMNRVI